MEDGCGAAADVKKDGSSDIGEEGECGGQTVGHSPAISVREEEGSFGLGFGGCRGTVGCSHQRGGLKGGR